MGHVQPHVIGDEVHEVAALLMGLAYSSVAVAYPLAKVWHATDTFFHRPYNWTTFKYTNSPFDDWKFRMRYGPVHKAELFALRTKMSFLHYGPKLVKNFQLINNMIFAGTVGKAYYDDGFKAAAGVTLDYLWDDYKTALPFLQVAEDIYNS